ncbi:hypothetical protein AB0B66_21150 [Catellatospora sp. NPDC049111]|uniref:hypothetical protein n=1 Tax=Catellatospora sp. NPDC049111 TaxID=3155271 RepID=UPI0033C1742D
MRYRQPLPSEQTVRSTLEQLRNEADKTGRAPSILALARRLGLANTTFRRHFPVLCTELTAHEPTPVLDGEPSSYAKLTREVDKLRRDNRELAEHLELAIANIQRLTMENHGLRQALEAARNVTRLPPQRRS